MSYEFEIVRRVEFCETDLAGLMHFSNFFRFMETAEHAFFRSLGFSVIGSREGLQVCLPRVHVECDYMLPLRFEDEVRVRLLVERKSRRSLTYQFRFSRLKGSEPEEVARGRMTVVSVKMQKDGSLKAVSLPPIVAATIQQAPAHVLSNGAVTGRASSSLTGDKVDEPSERQPRRLLGNTRRSGSASAPSQGNSALRPSIFNGMHPSAGSGADAPHRHD
jgi:YbgC/YbaW family acyl-CoA thioester hydrolase